MARAELVEQVKNAFSEEDRLAFMSEIIMFPLPVQTFKKLSEVAAARNMTVAQVLAKAIDEVLLKTDSR